MTARARGRRAARRRPPAHARAAACSRSYDPDAPGRRRRRARRLPARRRRAGRRRAARARRARRRPVAPTSGCATAAIYEDWYGEHGAPELFGERRLRAARAAPRARSRGADLVANPGCYPTAALLALAPLARAGLIGDVVIDAKSGVSGAGREPTRRTHFVSADENVTPYKVERPPPHARDRAGARARSGATLPITFTPHLRAARAGRARLLLRDAGARARRGRAAPSSTTTPTRASRSSSCATGRPACSRCATPTTAASRVHRDAAHGPRSSCSRRSTTCGRARRRRRSRTST